MFARDFAWAKEQENTHKKLSEKIGQNLFKKFVPEKKSWPGKKIFQYMIIHVLIKYEILIRAEIILMMHTHSFDSFFLQNIHRK